MQARMIQGRLLGMEKENRQTGETRLQLCLLHFNLPEDPVLADAKRLLSISARLEERDAGASCTNTSTTMLSKSSRRSTCRSLQIEPPGRLLSLCPCLPCLKSREEAADFAKAATTRDGRVQLGAWQGLDSPAWQGAVGSNAACRESLCGSKIRRLVVDLARRFITSTD